MNGGDGGVDAIVARQRQDLVAYLTRVRNLPAPTRDLVFMHSEAGVASGLEAASSDRLAAMARNGQTDGLAELLDKLPPSQQEAAVATLARWSGIFALAPERKNAVTVLLAATAAVGELSAETTALITGAVLSSPGELPAGALGDMVRLARRCRPPQRRQLVTKLRERDDVVKDSPARAALIASFPEFSNADNLYGIAMAMAVGQIDEEATKEVLTLPESEQAKLLKLAEPTVQGWINTAKEKAANPPEGEEPQSTASVNGWLLPALQLLEGSAVAVTRFAIWLLQAGNPQSDAEVQGRLNLLSPVSDHELLRLMLQRMRTVPRVDREAWLEAIDPAAIDPDAVGELDSVARQLWSERSAPEADPASFGGMLDRLAALAKALPVEKRGFPQVDAAIGEATQSPMDSEEAAQELLRISTAANEFVNHELADTTQSADRFTANAGSAMPGLPIGDLEQLPQLRSAVAQLLDDWLADASPAALQALREAATQEPDARLDATKAEALLRAAGRLREQGEEISPPLDASALGGLGRDYGEGADGALLAWLSHFADDGLWPVLAPMWGTQISPTIRQGFGAAAKHLPEPQRQKLAEVAFDQSLSTSAPPAANWEAIALRELSGTWVVKALAERKPGEDLERWRILLEIARQRVLSGKAKTLAANELLRPLAALDSDSAFELALDNLELASKDSGEEMLAGLKLTGDQARLVETKVRQLGWKKGAISRLLGGLLGSDEEPAEDEPEESDDGG
jgi:hypothetical protein